MGDRVIAVLAVLHETNAATVTMQKSKQTRKTRIRLDKITGFPVILSPISLLDDVVLQRRDKREDLAFLFIRHFELIKRRGEMFGSGVPVSVCDPESAV